MKIFRKMAVVLLSVIMIASLAMPAFAEGVGGETAPLDTTTSSSKAPTLPEDGTVPGISNEKPGTPEEGGTVPGISGTEPGTPEDGTVPGISGTEPGTPEDGTVPGISGIVPGISSIVPGISDVKMMVRADANPVVAGVFISTAQRNVDDNELTSMNPENICLTGEGAASYTFDQLNETRFFVTNASGTIAENALTSDSVKIDPADGAYLRISGSGDARFYLRPGMVKGDVQVTVTVASTPYTFTVTNPYAAVAGTNFVPALVSLNDDGALTSGMFSSGEAYPPQDGYPAHLVNHSVGVAFIDISDPNNINNGATYKKTLDDFTAATFDKAQVGNKPLETEDKVEGKGKHNKSGVEWAEVTTNSEIEWRNIAVTAEVTVNGTAYTAAPYMIQYGSYAGSSGDISVPVEPGTNNLIYISSVNTLIEQHAISEESSKNGVASPTLRFPKDAKIVAKTGETDVITIPTDKVIELFGPRPLQGNKADIYGSIEIVGNGSNKILLNNMALHGNKDFSNGGEVDKTPTRATAIGGMGVAVVENCTIEGYTVGLDMSLVDNDGNGKHDGTFNRSASKQAKTTTISNCGTGMIVGTSIQETLRNSTIENCTTGIALKDQVNQEYSLVFIRRNVFRNNSADMTYDEAVGGTHRIYATQNYFEDSSNASRKPIITGNLQCSPYYTDAGFTTLSADLANAKKADGNYDLPVDTTVDGGVNLSQTVFDSFKIEVKTRSGTTPTLTIPLRKGSNMTALPETVWGFAQDKLEADYTGTDGVALNLAVDQNIGGFDGTVGAYEPVSFKHSGKLPGIATISVKKTAALDTTKTLMLYKLVGRTPVKQPETVAAVGETLTFQRGDCSDYLVTDTEITASSTGGGGGSSGSDDYTSSEDVSDKLDSAGTGGSAVISVSGKPNVGSSAFDVLKKNPEKSLVLKGESYSWTFKGSDLSGNLAGALFLNTSISTTSPNAVAVQTAAGSAELQNVYFGYHGTLPGKATIELAVDKKFAGRTLNLYYYNAATGKFSLVQSGLTQTDGKVSFAITHCSDYILTPHLIPGAGVAAVQEVNPNTGVHDVVPVAAAIAATALLGAVLLMKKKD